MALGSLICLGFMAGCIVGDASDDAYGDDGEDGDALADDDALVLANTGALNIGFNDGFAEQFDYYPDFFDVAVAAGPTLCHAYVGWNVAHQAPHAGSIADHGSRAFIDDWFAKAQGHCDEALISFKSMTHGAPPSTSAFADAFEKFAAADWAAETGFTGKLSFTPWNEPNNGADSGNGLGVEIPPRVAARYYLVAERSCRTHGCKVAAGDFASNGNMWNDFEWNCANDNLAPAELCKSKSSMNPDKRAASYLDLYKNEIANGAQALGLPKGFRPAYFAFHGWHDSNRYLDAADHCSTYQTCTVRRLLRSLGGSWAGVLLWNTEDGIGQTSAPDDRAQACGAAFLLRLSTISPRIRRLYITRLHGGAGQLLVGHTPRPAMTVLAQRQRTFAGGNCR